MGVTDTAKGLAMDASLQEQYQATAVRATYVHLTTTRQGLGYVNGELKVPARDPDKVLQLIPRGVLGFRFYDRIVADIEVNGEPVTIRSEAMNLSTEWYFVNVDMVVARSDIRSYWYSDFYLKMLCCMNEGKADHVAYWGRPDYRCLAYRPDVDKLLKR